MSAPSTLARGGKALWKAITEAHDLDAAQLVQLQEACRAKDRLDELDRVLRGDVEGWPPGALVQANTTANTLKQLMAALRLPDARTGKTPQYRGPRVQLPAGRATSSLDRLRNAS